MGIGRRTLAYPALVVVLAFLAGACTGDDEATTTLEPTPEARTLIESALGTQAVQDFMIHLEMIIYDDDTFVSVLDEVVDRANEGAGETVNLGDGFTFTPVDTLNGRMVDDAGEVMSSLSVDFGLMAMNDDLARQVEDELRAELAGTEDGEQIADVLFGDGATGNGVLVEIVTASYDEAYVHAGFDDASEMDLSFLAIPQGAEMVVVHLFGLTLPGDPATEAGMTPHELFEYRWNQGLIEFLLDDNQNPEIITATAQLETTPPSQSKNLAPTLIQTAGIPGAAIPQLATDQPSEQEPDPDQALADAWDKVRKHLMKEQAFMEAMREAFEEGEAQGDRDVEKLVDELNYWKNSDAWTHKGVGNEADFCLGVAAMDFGLVVLIGTGPEPLVDYEPPFEGWPEDCGRPELVTPEGYATRLGLFTAAKVCEFIRNRIFSENDPVTAATGGQPSETTPGPGDTTDTDTTDPSPTPGDEPPSPQLNPCDPPPRSSGPPKDAGGVLGDVHMITLDGLVYPNQAAGEFLVFDNEVATVQMRTEPWQDFRTVSVVTAVAVRIGDSTASMHDGGHTWVDGQPAELEVGVPVAVGDGSLLWTGSSWMVVWADGTQMRVRDGRITGSMFFLLIPSQLPLTGMLGTPNGDHDDDLVPRGSDEPVPTSPEEEFYATFIDSWRISEDETLFHYEPGETTAGFHLEGFPSRHFTVSELDFGDRAQAEEACQRAGVTRQDILDACIFDVAITGDPGFIYAHSVMNATLPDPASPDPASPDPASPDPETPPPPIDAEQFVVIGPLALDIGPEPPLEHASAFFRRTCTLGNDGEAFGAIIAYEAPDQSVDVNIQYVAASAHPSGEDSLVVIVELDGSQRAWMNPQAMGRIDSLSFDGTNLTVTGAGFFKEDPSDEGLHAGAILPPGASLSPFTLQFSCAP